MKKPKSYDEYLGWAREHLGSDFEDKKVQRVYGVNIRAFNVVLSEHSFFSGLQNRLDYWEQEYERKAKSRLFMDRSPPERLLKPYKSAVDKSFRVNVLWNDNFPDGPKHGWVTSKNLCYYFNDVVRCSIVCKFIDGPRFVTDQLMALARELGLKCRRYTQERDEGYYAYHFYVKFPVQVMDFDWEQHDATLEVEIQVTTQLQDVLRRLTHNFYKRSRLSSESDSTKWKWNFKSNQFRVSYLSHALHLLESIILEAREEVNVIDKMHNEEVSSDEK